MNKKSKEELVKGIQECIDKRREEEFKRISETSSTQGWEKVRNYYLEISKQDYFQDKIRELREIYKIPDGQFTYERLLFRTKEEFEREISPEIQDKVGKILNEICDKYCLSIKECGDVIENYVYLNKIIYNYELGTHNLCFVEDINSKKETDDLEDKHNYVFPIAIRINPYASQRDIIDFIKKMYPTIKEYQNKYWNKKVRLGRIKNKKESVTLRNDFIWENRNKPLKEIMSLAMGRGYDLDYGHISKIISLEKQKRKDV